MFCPYCGEENPANTAVCARCGQATGSIAVTAAAPPPPAQSTATPPLTGLGTLLGVRSPEIEWGAGVAFLVACILGDLVFLLIVPLLRYESALPGYWWVHDFSADLLMTGAAVACFRLVRDDIGASALASAGYTVLQTVNRLVILPLFLHGPQWPPVRILYSLIFNFLFLLLLALAVRWIRPLWLGLWLGATGARLATSMAYRVGSFLYTRLHGQFSSPFRLGIWEVATDLLFAAVFAFAFWEGLALMAPRVLRDS